MRALAVSAFFCACAGVFVGATAACDGGTGFACECFSCTGAAITLNAIDKDGNAVGGAWFVDAQLDGTDVDTSACDPAVRNGTNNCSFGISTGVYEIVVRSELEEKELKARFAGRAGQDCCSCINGESIPVVLATE